MKHVRSSASYIGGKYLVAMYSSIDCSAAGSEAIFSLILESSRVYQMTEEKMTGKERAICPVGLGKMDCMKGKPTENEQLQRSLLHGRFG